MISNANDAHRSLYMRLDQATHRLLTDDLVLNPEFFPNVKVGDLIEVSGVDKDPAGEKAMIFKVQNLAPVKGAHALLRSR